MKENKAPEKIYLTSDEKNSYVFTRKRSDNMGIEYTRTDAFIKKASFWLECNLSDRPIEDRKFWVEDFVNCMKGE